MASNRKIRVLLLSSVFVDRGAERIILWLYYGLPKDEYDVHIASLRNLVPFADRLRLSGEDIVDVIGMRHQLDFVALVRLYFYFRRMKPDILHIHSFRAALWGRPIGRLARIPIIMYSVHNKWGGKIHYFLDRVGSLFGDAIVPFSKAVKTHILVHEKIADKRVTEPIYIGIETRRFSHYVPDRVEQLRKDLGVRKESTVVGFVGAISEQKGLIYLVKSIKVLESRYPNILCLIIGEGPQEVLLKTEIKKMGLQDKIVFLGQRYDVDLLLHLMDIFVLPSLWEGLPQVVLEAMAAGCPVIATKVDGTPEIVQNGINGLLVDSRDAEAIANAIDVLLKNEDLRIKLATRAQKYVQERFDVENMVGNFSRFYKAMIRRKQKGEDHHDVRGNYSGAKHANKLSSIDERFVEYLPVPNKHFPQYLLPTRDSSPIHYFTMNFLSSQYDFRNALFMLFRVLAGSVVIKAWPYLAPKLARLLCSK